MIAAFVGAAAAYLGGLAEKIILEVIHFLLVVPSFLILALVSQRAHGDWPVLILVLTVFGWMFSARVVWSLTTSLREREYVQAARYMGVGRIRIVLRHLIPNLGSLLIVSFTLGVVATVQSETALSFIGFGVQPPDVSLGTMLSDGANTVSSAPWLFFVPGRPGHAADRVHGTDRRRAARRPRPDLPLRRPGVSIPVLSVRDLRVSFPSEAGRVDAVRGVDFDLLPGRTLGIVGESGSGKSATSLAVMGLLPEYATVSGSITLNGRELLGLDDRQLSTIRGRELGMIFQDPMSSLTPIFSVGRQLVEALQIHQDLDRDVARKRAVELLDLVGIPERRGSGAVVPARVLRGDAPAGRHRDGDRQRPEGDHRRRADHRTGRHRPGPDPGGARSSRGRRPAPR